MARTIYTLYIPRALSMAHISFIYARIPTVLIRPTILPVNENLAGRYLLHPVLHRLWPCTLLRAGLTSWSEVLLGAPRSFA